MVRFYNGRGVAEQWTKEAKNVVNLTFFRGRDCLISRDGTPALRIANKY